MNLLFIDDDPDTRRLARELLRETQPASGEAAEIRLLEAAGVEDAVARYGNIRPDAILLLPTVKQTWDCPVWIVTGLADQSLAGRCLRNGAAGLILKDVIMEKPQQWRSLLLKAPGQR